MRHVSTWLTLSCLLSAVMACSGGDSDGGPGGSGAGTSAGGTSAGGTSAGGSSAGGAAGSATGGTSAGGASGASAGSTVTGGASGATAGGASGAATGGTAGASAGGATGGTSAGSAVTGGTAGTGAGGTAGAGAGGAAGSGASGQGPGGSTTAGNAGSGPVDHGPITGLTISPSVATIKVTGGVSTPQQFDALPVYQDGFTGAPVDNVTWAIDQADLATINPTGLTTATGARAGEATLSALWQNLPATAQLTVTLEQTTGVDTIPPGTKGPLDGASNPGAGGAQLSYPYNNTVFPRGLLAPEFMWTNIPAGEPMKLTLQSELVLIESYFTAPADARYTLPQDLWTKLTEAGKGGPVNVKLARLGDGTGAVVASHTWRIASGSLRGVVYYWSNNIGRVLRIKPGATAPDDFLAAPLQAAGVDPNACTTCHAVSANGRKLLIGGAPETGDSAASVFDLTSNTLTRKSNQGYGRPWAMATLTPDGQYAVLNDANQLPGYPGKGGGLYNVDSAQLVPGTSLDANPLWMPAFSPDGSGLAYVNRTNGALAAIDYNQSLLPGNPFSNPRDLVPQAGPNGNGEGIAFPYPSPDGKWAVYHRGALDTRYGAGDMYLADMKTPGVEIPLDNLSGRTYPFVAGDRDRHYNYEPTFMPLGAGGYYWVVFTSRRTYGNRLTSPNKDAVKQLWVAAVDQNPKPGQDPSHPAFWVPGQGLNDYNMRAFWTLDPCREDGTTCDNASECCSKVCLPNGTCGGGQSATCKQVGELCSDASDCCYASAGYQCINSHCTEAKP